MLEQVEAVSIARRNTSEGTTALLAAGKHLRLLGLHRRNRRRGLLPQGGVPRGRHLRRIVHIMSWLQPVSSMRWPRHWVPEQMLTGGMQQANADIHRQNKPQDLTCLSPGLESSQTSPPAGA